MTVTLKLLTYPIDDSGRLQYLSDLGYVGNVI